jgi:hypothetical protein
MAIHDDFDDELEETEGSEEAEEFDVDDCWGYDYEEFDDDGLDDDDF